ncbi:uncharacterized protein B0P05DRAFT_559606 [Gilbertella persicaria]|uniref:uncharacterized protein n=1 Tax=Gilbertella persicaria TaxID=101096 RepID=UPI00221FB1AE|nr:uncharacterized protein B0P05DRAFT_559606 [Gilbertella persicaria]KAI8057525.1 hypothetical protein B0P05DRAFT_559606 [Gilbertella persicaria]
MQSLVFSILFFLYIYYIMPSIDHLWTTPEDMMPTSALSVSPIMTHSLFEDTQDRIGIVLPPPPPTRWTRRLESRRLYQCLNEQACNTSPLLTENGETIYTMLDFDVIYDDGGQYGAMYGVENVLSNDGSVYCSGRKGTVNLLLQYCGYVKSKIIADTSCSVSKMIIKAPQHGFTAPCKEGLVFISHKEINVQDTAKFDHFTRQLYEEYKQTHQDDTDPVAWFTLAQDRTCTIDLETRSGKYMLIKLLRAEVESDNIDVQYIGLIGYAGARSFVSAKLR